MNPKKLILLNEPRLVYILSGLIAFLWWIAFNPGFFSSDSFALMEMLKSKKITSEWTTIWAYSVNVITFGGSQPQLATLFFSQLLAVSVSYFLLTFFESKKALILSIILCSTPLVGAMGITLWHDIPMTSGFLLFLGALRRREAQKKSDYLVLALGGVLASFRFNGLPTLIVFVILILAISKNRQYLVGVLTILVALTGVSVALNTEFKSHLNVQSDGFIDWMRYDISCYASNSKDESFFESNFNGELSRDDWSSKTACIYRNDSTAFRVRTESVNTSTPRAWLNLVATQPLFVLKTHLDRHKYLVPVPYSGRPHLPFIHTTIEIPSTYINLTYPKVSELLRSYPRIWNYFSFIFGYAGLWLFILFLVAWRKKSPEILKLALLGLVLNSGIFVFATISDGRFALPLLITAQIVVLSEFLDWLGLKLKSKKVSRGLNCMKISILLESFQPEYWGGRETRWKNLIELLSESHQLVIYGDFSRISSDIAFPGVQAEFINLGVLPPMYGSNGNRSLKHAVMYTSKAYKILFSKSDILLTDQTPLISIPIVRLFCLLSRTQLSVTWHEVWSLQTWFRYSRLLGIFGVLLQEIALLFSKNIVVPSVEVAADLEKRLFSRKSIVIANGAKPSLHMRRVNLNQAKNSSVQLLYVGRLIKHKNCDFLVDVMELASGQGKNWKLTIIGIGPLEARLRELVADKKLQECITFKSNVPEIELMDQYSKSDILVFPSQREGYGISVAEAISHGLPVIVYDYPENAATSLLQTKVSGLKIKKLEASVWIAAIEELLLNQDGNQLQNQVKIAKWESIANEYSEFLNSLMQSRNSSFEL